MKRKRLVLFGTRHWKATDIPAEIRQSLALLIDRFHPDVTLEEWSVTQVEQSGAASVSESKNVPWESIGTPPEEKFRTYGYESAADFPSAAEVNQYGPLQAQEVREQYMCESIAFAMGSHTIGLVVLGVAHLHSIFAKLSETFEVTGYAYRLELF